MYEKNATFDLRPAGKFLATSRGRYLVGREICLLMGLPVHKLKLGTCNERASCLIIKLDRFAMMFSAV